MTLKAILLQAFFRNLLDPSGSRCVSKHHSLFILSIPWSKITSSLDCLCTGLFKTILDAHIFLIQELASYTFGFSSSHYYFAEKRNESQVWAITYIKLYVKFKESVPLPITMDISPVTSDEQDAESGVHRSPWKSVHFLLFIGAILIVNLIGGPEILGILLMPMNAISPMHPLPPRNDRNS